MTTNQPLVDAAKEALKLQEPIHITSVSFPNEHNNRRFIPMKLTELAGKPASLREEELPFIMGHGDGHDY